MLCRLIPAPRKKTQPALAAGAVLCAVQTCPRSDPGRRPQLSGAAAPPQCSTYRDATPGFSGLFFTRAQVSAEATCSSVAATAAQPGGFRAT